MKTLLLRPTQNASVLLSTATKLFHGRSRPLHPLQKPTHTSSPQATQQHRQGSYYLDRNETPRLISVGS